MGFENEKPRGLNMPKIVGEERFTYDKEWDQIYEKLRLAEEKQNAHFLELQKAGLSKKQKMHHVKQIKGLEGAITTLRWVLGDSDFDPLIGKIN